MRLTFFRHDNGTIETRHQAAEHHCGFDTVIHGEIQAAILDEVMGVAAHGSLPTKAPDLACATAEMRELTTATSRWPQMRTEPI
ncbi:MAG: hypothetical protein NZ605_12670 [Acidimicrobiales bacterium]|nr:hypothetical protein [Acidimicrobiales bacterium]